MELLHAVAPFCFTIEIFMKYKNIFLFLFFFLLCFECYGADIPFTVEKGYVIVPVKVKKNISVEMVINTGLDVSLIDADSAQKNSFPAPSYTTVGQVTGKNDKTVVFNDVSGILIGDENSVDLSMQLSDLTTIKTRVGRDIFGILGADFFRGKSVKFDFKNKVLSFLKNPYSPDSATGKSSGFPMICKMVVTKTNVFGKEIVLPVCDDVLINEKKLKTLFDTGTGHALFIMPSATKVINVESTEKDQTKSIQISSLKFSDYEFKDIPATVFGKDVVPDQYRKGTEAIIGIGVLQNFIVNFDFKRNLIVLDK